MRLTKNPLKFNIEHIISFNYFTYNNLSNNKILSHRLATMREDQGH